MVTANERTHTNFRCVSSMFIASRVLLGAATATGGSADAANWASAGSRLRHIGQLRSRNGTGAGAITTAGAEAAETLFLHIPKNAGSAIETVGLQQKVWWGRQRLAALGMVRMHDGSSCSGHHVPPAMLPAEGRQVYADRRVFCIVRHPYERAISEYVYLLSEPWGDLNPGALVFDPCSEAGLNFFLQYVLAQVLDGKRFYNDCHMLPQVHYLADEGGEPGCNDALRFEELPESFNAYMAGHHMSMRLGVLENESRHRCPGLNISSLDSRTMEMLDFVYAEDFARFDYHRGYPASIQVPLYGMS